MTSSVHITKINKDSSSDAVDQLAVEEPLQIQVLYQQSAEQQIKNLAITMRTPGNDQELAAGFLFTEGFAQNKRQLIRITSEPSDLHSVLAVFHGCYPPPELAAERNFYVSSSCGVCGKASIDMLKKQPPFSTSAEQLSIKANDLYSLPARLRNAQRLFQATGGLHACALLDQGGELIMLREDVGRHNALDKLIGALFLTDHLPADSNVLLLSGRASFELVQKAAMAGIQVIAAIGAPSSLAVEIAVENGITLVGFLKEDRFNIYSCPQRINQSSV